MGPDYRLSGVCEHLDWLEQFGDDEDHQNFICAGEITKMRAKCGRLSQNSWVWAGESATLGIQIPWRKASFFVQIIWRPLHLLSYCPNKIYIDMEGRTSLPFVHDGCRGWGHSQSVPWSLFHDYLGWCHFGEEIRFPLKVSTSRVLFEKLNTISILFILHQ